MLTPCLSLSLSLFFPSADQALDRFAMKKFYDDKVSDLMQPSQKRYVYVPEPEWKGKMGFYIKNVTEEASPLTAKKRWQVACWCPAVTKSPLCVGGGEPLTLAGSTKWTQDSLPHVLSHWVH